MMVSFLNDDNHHVNVVPVVVRVTASCALVSTWLIQFFLQPLRQDAINMHEQQLDPTEIVLIPYPWQRLSIYVGANVVATICVQSSSIRRRIQTILDVLQLSGMMLILFVVCGASPYHNVYHTYLASVYYVTCTFFQYPLIFVDAITGTTASSSGGGVRSNETGTDDSTNHDTDTLDKNPLIKWHYQNPSAIHHNSMIRISLLLDIIQQQLRGRSVGIVGTNATTTSSSSSSPEHKKMVIVLHQSIIYCCTIVTVLFQILLLYDRGYQIQRYPIPIILGCTIGWIVGACVGSIRAMLYFHNQQRSDATS